MSYRTFLGVAALAVIAFGREFVKRAPRAAASLRKNIEKLEQEAAAQQHGKATTSATSQQQQQQQQAPSLFTNLRGFAERLYAENSGASNSKVTMASSAAKAGRLDEDVKRFQIPLSVTESTSRANFHAIRVRHLSLALNVDFTKKKLFGTSTLTCERLASAATELILDTKGLTIHEASVGVSGGQLQPTTFTVDPKPHAAFGQALRVRIPTSPASSSSSTATTTANADSAPVEVRLSYETGADSSALQWLEPEQTVDKAHPYLFTQCQAIHARSFFPCQDAPAVKATYDAAITVPAPLTAIMSAHSTGSTPDPATMTIKYTFKQDVPISSYLIALAVGRLESRDLSPRIRVWSEPSVVDLARKEFADAEKFVSTAESIFGEYVWGRYDMLLMPKSFPYGGMENPCLTFLTPTLIAGDKSLTDVVIHEIMHSWFGNLVTNATWSDFWMNEGFTVFSEHRVVSKLYGEQRAALKAVIGRRHLEDDVKRLEASGDKHFTRLNIPMTDVDPDDSFSSVPYEKGCAFLEHLERIVGGPDKFEPFLREYVAKFRYGIVEVPSFRAFFAEKFPHAQVPDWDEWVYGEGMPPLEASAGSSILVDMAETAAAACVTAAATGNQQLAKSALAGANSWAPDQIIVFLERLIKMQEASALPADVLRIVDETFKLRATKNCETRFRFHTLCLRAKDETIFPEVAAILREQGRMKYTRPLYRDLAKCSDNGRALALETFAKERKSLHAIAEKMVAKDLGVQ